MESRTTKPTNLPRTGEMPKLSALSLPEGRDHLCVLPVHLLREHLSQVVKWVAGGNFAVPTNHKRPVALLSPVDQAARNALAELRRLGATRDGTPYMIQLTQAQARTLRGE